MRSPRIQKISWSCLFPSKKNWCMYTGICLFFFYNLQKNLSLLGPQLALLQQRMQKSLKTMSYTQRLVSSCYSPCSHETYLWEFSWWMLLYYLSLSCANFFRYCKSSRRVHLLSLSELLLLLTVPGRGIIWSPSGSIFGTTCQPRSQHCNQLN